MVMYYGALQVGKVIKLRQEDIDSNRKLIRIKTVKDKKDRHILISDGAVQILREYWKKDRPEKWLSPSWNREKHITAHTGQKIF